MILPWILGIAHGYIQVWYSDTRAIEYVTWCVSNCSRRLRGKYRAIKPDITKALDKIKVFIGRWHLSSIVLSTLQIIDNFFLLHFTFLVWCKKLNINVKFRTKGYYVHVPCMNCLNCFVILTAVLVYNVQLF